VPSLPSFASDGVNRFMADGARDARMDFEEAVWMATLGGAEALGLGARIGSFAAGKAFDALLVDTSMGGSLEVFDESDSLEDVVQKFFNLGDDRHVLGVWVQGRRVKGGDP
jgi:guanine deaminase